MADDLPLTQDRELISDFTVENREHLRAIEANVLRLERDAADADAIHGAFREFHTIKALAGFLEFKAMEEVAHEVETILDHARTGQITISAEIIDVIFQGVDYLEQWTDALETSLDSGTTPTVPEHAALSARIRAVTMPDRSGSELELLAGAVSQHRSAASKDTAREARLVRVDAARLDHLLGILDLFTVFEVQLTGKDPVRLVRIVERHAELMAHQRPELVDRANTMVERRAGQAGAA
jgi:two-component system chemotaxis sensor kinase CheA